MKWSLASGGATISKVWINVLSSMLSSVNSGRDNGLTLRGGDADEEMEM
jgi:hypothetical protein